MEVRYCIANQRSGTIPWVATEDFSSIRGKWYDLSCTTAKCIERMDLDLCSKILLSAVAGAVIQHLLDLHIDANLIFSEGRMYIEE